MFRPVSLIMGDIPEISVWAGMLPISAKVLHSELKVDVCCNGMWWKNQIYHRDDGDSYFDIACVSSASSIREQLHSCVYLFKRYRSYDLTFYCLPLFFWRPSIAPNQKPELRHLFAYYALCRKHNILPTCKSWLVAQCAVLFFAYSS